MKIVKKTIVIPVTIVTEPWLDFCIKSISDNLIGYDEIVVVNCEDLDIAINLPSTKIQLCDEAMEIDREYLIRSYAVMHADTFTDSDMIVIMLPNFILCRKFNLNNLIIDGKPTILCDTYASLSRQTGDIFQTVQNWQSSTEQVLGLDSVNLEFARTMPIMYPFFVFAELRDFLKKRLDVPTMIEYFNEIDNDKLPEGFCFSDFNVIGAYLYEKHNDAVNWIVMSKAKQLFKFLSSTIGFFETVFDETEAKTILEAESTKNIYHTIVKKYLVDLAKGV